MKATNQPIKQWRPMAHGYRPPTTEPGPSGGVIVVDTKFMPLAVFFYAFQPSIGLDAASPTACAWGENAFSVAPGRHLVHVYVPYFLPSRVGSANLVADVLPGQTVRLEYRAPLIAWAKGSLGPPPQRYNGAWALALIVGALPLLATCAFGLSLLSPH